MKRFGKNKCPKCGFGSFDTEPNQYQILEFDGKFEEIKTEGINKKNLRVFCRNCGSEIDEQESILQGKVILKNQ
ncbi:MAG: hypothetical protein O8C61_00740 [Candidatus Methanoperedens sp.]|nr:hypothetical protein [Candidatus Methanoperedens sp.]